MKRFLKQLQPVMLGFTLIAASALPALADDTEIYFGGGNASAKNNILFVIDTSGSMDSLDGDSTTRLDELKAAFKSLLTQVDNVNVGLMRFSNPGGPILYPVTNINTVIPSDGSSSNLDLAVQSANDDGYQQNTSGAVDLSGQRLEMGTVSIGGISYYPYSKRISVTTDDADGCADSNSANTSREYIIVTSNTCDMRRIMGVRFETVNIPKPTAADPVVIDSAYLEFSTIVSGGTAPIDLSIYGEKSSGSTFGNNTASPPYRLSNTANIISTHVDLSLASLPAIGTVLDSPDISALVQSMVDDTSWASGNAMTFLIRHPETSSSTGYTTFFSSDSMYASIAAPVLVINYHVGSGTASTYDTTAAVRFSEVNVPRHATVTSAYLEFTAATSSSDTTALNISADASGNSAALSTADFDITSRASTSASVTWDASSTPAMTGWTAGTSYQTPDLAAVVQQIVNRSDWCGGNAMTLKLAGTGHRSAASYDAGSGTAPHLVIKYDLSSVPTDGSSCKKTTLTRQVAASSDDAQEDDGAIANLTNDRVYMASTSTKTGGRNGTTTYTTSKVGLRFTNIQIPKNSTIQSAYLQFVARSDDNTSLNLSINGQATDDAATFTSALGAISGRSSTSAVVSWNGVSTWYQDSTYQSPDVSSIVQEIVNRSGWAAGNDMAFIISGLSATNRREAYSYNGSPGDAPKLIVNFVDNGSSPSTYTVRDKLIEIVDSLAPNGSTPLQDTFYEGVQYFRGQAVDYGKVRGAGPYSYTRVSHPDSYTGGSVSPAGCQDSSDDSCKSETISGSPVYKSPITFACQANHIVLLTDGLPNSDHSTSKIHALPGFPSTQCTYAGAGECVPDLAKWVHETTDISSTLEGDQHLTVDTIAFYQDSSGNSFLQDTATYGGGTYSAAAGSDALLEALQKVTTSTISQDSTFVSAGVAVNAFNRTQNLDNLYFAVFKPGLAPRWEGNLKRYALAADSSGDPFIADATGANAVDASTGFFKDSSRSYWSASADGADVEKGGAAAMITDYAARKLYTDTGSSSDLADASNALVSTNTALTKAMFGDTTMTDTYLKNLINWVRGQAVDTESGYDVNTVVNTSTATRFDFADPLHSRPVAITYGGTESSPDITIFVGTNDGTLHAIDNSDGSEVFGYIPSDLLSIQETLYNNTEGVDHPYGLDGSITPWVIDPDGDGLVLTGGVPQTDNKVWLFEGMRRGGRNYYALDVTNRAHPKLMWTIKGGVTAGFDELGQTWSQPVKAKISINGTEKRVLIFGGGYDPAQDTATTRQADSMGAAIYIVDAETGALIWSGGNGDSTEFTKQFSDMLYGIPSSVAAADINGDDLVDYFFVGDMGGQVWRFDVNNEATSASTLITGGVIARLGVGGTDSSGTTVANTPADNRRFYHAPTLFPGENNGTPYLGIGIGSGWRAHPLSEDTTDKFYMIKQSALYAPPRDASGAIAYSAITESTLYDADANVIQTGTSDQKEAALTDLAGKDGWYLTMAKGEKVLSTPLVLNGSMLFDTYQPGVLASADPCLPQTGTNRAYEVSAADATGVVDYDGDGVPDRFNTLNVSGIADGSSYTNSESTGSTTMNGSTATSRPIDNINSIYRIYWYEDRTRTSSSTDSSN